jgi:hypothetical protein
MDAEAVREHIATMRIATPSRAARKGMAELAIKHANCTEEARNVWRAYLAEFDA